MVSAGNQGLGLSDKLGEELLRHLKVEMCDVAMGMSPGTAAPIHTDTLLALMFELLPYDNSDKSEFSEERFHSFLSQLHDEIIEEEKRREEPEPESAYRILLQLQQTVGQMAGQMSEISRKVQRHDEILLARTIMMDAVTGREPQGIKLFVQFIKVLSKLGMGCLITIISS